MSEKIVNWEKLYKLVDIYLVVRNLKKNREMKELKYLKSNSTGQIGVDYLGSMVKHHNCIFQEIDTKIDLGVDAIIEIIKDERPTSKFLAVQVKSGKSYYNRTKNLCKIPVKNHFEYWSKHPLPVYGIVYIPEFGDAYWVDIKKYLKANPEKTVISFERTLANQINQETFFSIFIKRVLNEVPDLSYDFAKSLMESNKKDEFYLGLYTLFKKFADRNEVWDIFINYFKTKPFEEIPGILVYYISHCPWHPDLYYANDSYNTESQKYGNELISKFQIDEVIKLLQFIDEDEMLSRGSLGQSVEAIISEIENYETILKEIILSDNYSTEIREVSSVIYAYKTGIESIPVLEEFENDETWLITEIINHLKEYGEYNPY